MIAQDFAALDAILADDVLFMHATAVAEDKAGYHGHAGLERGVGGACGNVMRRGWRGRLDGPLGFAAGLTT